MQESILVVPREVIIPSEQENWCGLKKTSQEECIQMIAQHQEFHPRHLMETDSRYKQIIPYLVYIHNQQIFVMQRKSTASEQRLANKLSIGIGGHMRQEDMAGGSLIAWAQRELHEEVELHDPYRIEVLGMLNDDRDAVGQVHVGLVLLLLGTSERIAIRSELKSGKLMSLSECMEQITLFESWSQLVLAELAQHSAML